jgi:hypothetical protein
MLENMHRGKYALSLARSTLARSAMIEECNLLARSALAEDATNRGV